MAVLVHSFGVFLGRTDVSERVYRLGDLEVGRDP